MEGFDSYPGVALPDSGAACRSDGRPSANYSELGDTPWRDEPPQDISREIPANTCSANCDSKRIVEVTDKAWGWAVEVERTEQYRAEFCYGRSGYSSLHHHEHLCNHFLMVRGILDIEIQRGITQTFLRLEDGDSLLVLPGEEHRLIVVSPCYFIETYFRTQEGDSWDDIVREDASSSEPYCP